MPTPVSTGSLTIADLNDGLYALLSSETGLVHCDSAGTPTTPLTTAPLTTMMTVYKGNSVQTGFSFARTASSGVTSSVNASGVLSVTGLTVDSGWVDITAAKSGEPSITKRYVISKVKQGIQGPQGLIGPQGNVGPVGQGIDSITEQYAISTSKTTPPAEGSTDWKDVAPTWSTGKYLWTRSKIVYKNPTDTKYTTPVCDSSWEAAIEVGDEVRNYVQSRGENLVTNGSALLGNNTNFSSFVYDGTEAYYTSGSFKYVGAGTRFTDEFMPVNPELSYKLTMFAKTANGVGRYYAMVGCFDVDSLSINAQHHMYRANTLTTLAQDLNNGDTVAYLTSASNWYNDGTADINTHLRSFIFWDYVNSLGYTYPPLTYSRNWFGNAWDPGAIDFANNTITLKTPWTGGTKLAGTQLSNGSSGGSYKYLAMSNTIVPTVWTKYTGNMNGIDLSGTNASYKFPPGTAKSKIGWLLNYQGSGETIWFANLSFNIDFASQSDLKTTTDVVALSVKSSDVEYYLSTSATSLSGGSWQTTAPTWVDGKYMWSRTRVELNNGTVRYTPSESGTCIAGAKGATGTPSIMGLLTNDSHVVPTDSAGNNGNFNGCSTTVMILVGTSDDSANWGVTATPTNVTGTLSGKTYTVTGLSADVGYVDFSATRSGYATIPLRFTVTRSKQGATGAPATAYWLVSSVAAIKKSIAGAYTPTAITFSAKSQTGTGTPANYSGRFKIQETTNGTTWIDKYTSPGNEATTTYTPSAGIVSLKCSLYLAGGTSTLLDEEIVPIVSDGATGSPGTSITSVEVEYAISTSNTTAPTTGWSTTSPAWEDGKFMWSRVKTSYSVGDPTYTNPACITGAAGPKGDTGEQGPQGPIGEPGQLLGLHADTSIITVSPRGELRTEEIIFSVNTHDIADLSDIEWKLSYEENIGDGLDYVYLSESVIDYSKRVLNCNTVFVDNFTLSVTYTVGTRVYSDSLAISKVIDGSAIPAYQNASATIPVITSEGALIRDDFFLYVGPYIGNGTAPTEEDLEEYRKDGKLTEVPASVNNEFIYGRLYKYVGQESAACTIGQTASNSIIISNAAALVYAVGLTVYLNSEPARRTITGITTYDVGNKRIALSGAAFDTTTDSLMYIDVWSESRDSKNLSAASADALEIARNSDAWLYCAVLVAQLGLFGELLIENELRSTNYASHMEGSGGTAKEVPDMGFKLNGKLGEILAYALRAYEADIYGNLTASGFKTLQEQAGRTIPVASITPTVWKHSEMEALIANQDSLATVSGVINGFVFARAVRRANKRILQRSTGYEYEAISAGEEHFFTRLTPDIGWGMQCYVEYSGYYQGNFSYRRYIKRSGAATDNLPTSYSRAYIENIDWVGQDFCCWHKSEALFDFGAKPSYVNYHNIWTPQIFTGIVLTTEPVLRAGSPGYGACYGFDYRVIPFEPTAYYSNTKTWTIGSYNQNSIANYCSGTAFYNLFSSLAIGADGFCDGGQINVNGTPYTVTRLTKAANSITFYTSGGVITVNKFQEGTNVGVYTELAVTQAINFQAVVGGIEVKHIFPWGTQAGSPGTYDIGTANERFNTAYLNYLDALKVNGFRVQQGNDTHPQGNGGSIPVVATDGGLEVGSYIDFHATAGDYSARVDIFAGDNRFTFNKGLAAPFVNTGYGDNEVYKITNELINGDYAVVSMSTMGITEIRFVCAYLRSADDGSPRGSVKLPAGGTYVVVGSSNYDSDIKYPDTYTPSSPVYYPGGYEIAFANKGRGGLAMFIVRRIS